MPKPTLIHWVTIYWLVSTLTRTLTHSNWFSDTLAHTLTHWFVETNRFTAKRITDRQTASHVNLLIHLTDSLSQTLTFKPFTRLLPNELTENHCDSLTHWLTLWLIVSRDWFTDWLSNWFFWDWLTMSHLHTDTLTYVTNTLYFDVVQCPRCIPCRCSSQRDVGRYGTWQPLPSLPDSWGVSGESCVVHQRGKNLLLFTLKWFDLKSH